MNEPHTPNDEIVFKNAYNELYNKLLRFVAGYIPDKDEAENIVQNCFTKLWENRSKVLYDKNLTGWLFTVAKHESLSYISHRRVETSYEISVYQRELNANYNALSRLDFDQLNQFDIEDIIRKTLTRLPKRSREVFELSRDKNKRNCDIAIECNISVKAVEAHITKALHALRLALKEYI
jgi:RNA polymerase sigma-70 factor, ECF subfamily